MFSSFYFLFRDVGEYLRENPLVGVLVSSTMMWGYVWVLYLDVRRLKRRK